MHESDICRLWGLVNNNLQPQYNANLLSYVEQLKKIVTVKSVTAQKKPQKKPEPGRISIAPAESYGLFQKEVVRPNNYFLPPTRSMSSYSDLID